MPNTSLSGMVALNGDGNARSNYGTYSLDFSKCGDNKTIAVRTGPGSSYTLIKQLSENTTARFVVYEVKNGYYRVSANSDKTEQWINATYMKKEDTSSSSTSTNTSNSSNYAINSTYDFQTDSDMVEKNDSILNWPDSDTYKDMSNYTNMFGAPFLFLKETDPCYIPDDADVPKVGRVMMDTLYSAPDCFSLCPGKVRYLPGFNKEDKQRFFDKVMEGISAATNDDENIGGFEQDGVFGGKLYDFVCDYTDYMNRYNVLARTSAIMLGLGETKMPGTNIPLKQYDYSYYTTSSRKVDAVKGMGATFLWQLEMGVESTIIEKNQYIHFFITNEGTSVTQDFTTSSTQSPLESIIHNSQLSDAGKNLTYLFGGAMSGNGFVGQAAKDVEKLVENASSSGSYTGSFAKMALGYLKGGKMVMPDMIDEVGYNNAVQCRMKFQSLTGDKLDIFLRTILPALAILNFVMPKQVSENMYTYPYLVRGYQQGKYNCDLGFIQDMSLERGGQDNTSWTVDGLSTELEVTFNIIPLYSSMMGGNGKNPFQFMTNTALLEYLGNMCGLDLKVNNFGLKQDLFNNIIANRFRDIPASIGSRASNKISNAFRSFQDWFTL